MSERVNNPFINYKAPGCDQILNPIDRSDVLNLEVILLKRGVKRRMHEEKLKDFFEGHPFKYDYDCRRLDPFITFPDANAELYFVANNVIAGIQLGLQEIFSLESELDFEVSYGASFDEAQPRLAKIAVSVSDPMTSN